MRRTLKPATIVLIAAWHTPQQALLLFFFKSVISALSDGDGLVPDPVTDGPIAQDSAWIQKKADTWQATGTLPMTATLTVSPAEVTLLLSMRSIVKGDGHAASRLEPSTDAAEVEMELEAAAWITSENSVLRAAWAPTAPRTAGTMYSSAGWAALKMTMTAMVVPSPRT